MKLRSHYHETNDPYRFALDNNLGPLECHVIKYVARHEKKREKRDLLAAIGTLTRLVQEKYPDSKLDDIAQVVTEAWR